MPAAECPRPEDIRAFLSDELPESSATRIKEHLLECDECETTVRELERVDPFLSELRRIAGTSGPDSACPDDSDCRDALDRVKSTVRDQLGSITEPAAPRETTEGTSLTGKHLNQYVLLEQIGKGGMGEVYKALHLPLNRHVAIKVLPPRQQSEKDRVLRFLREMQTQGEVDRHAHIVYATDAGEADGMYYLVMELVGGRDLSQLLGETGGPLNLNDACAIIRHVALALSYLHGRELVHRDVKPSNVILGSDGTAKLLDLGLAKLIRSDHGPLTDPTQIVGSFQYSSPEQVSDVGQVGPATDIYGLGATFYELLTGQPPLRLDNGDAFVRTIVSETPTPVSDRRTDIAEEVDELLCSMLAKDPEGRPSASDVAKMLERHSEGCDLRAPSGADPSVMRNRVPRGGTRQVAQPASFGKPERKWNAARLSIAAGCLLLPLLLLVGWRTIRSPTSENPTQLPDATEPGMRSPSWQPGPLVFPGLIPTPASIPGVHGWQVDTVLPRSGPLDIAWNPDGTLVAVTGYGSYVRVYEVDGSRLTLRTMLPHAMPIYSVAWSPDGASVATVGELTAVSIWQVGDTTAKLRVKREAHLPGASYAGWHPTQNTLATCGEDGTLKLWDAQGTLLSSWELSEKPQYCAAWSPNGSSLIAGGSDGILRWVTDAQANDSQTIAEVGSPIKSLAWHPSDDLVAVGTETGGIQIRAVDGEHIQDFSAVGSSVRSVRWSPDGRKLAVLADSLSTADYSGKKLADDTTQIDVTGVAAWNPVDESLIWCNWYGIRRLSKASPGEPTELASTSDRRVLAVDWHPSGNTLATAGIELVRVWGDDGSPRATIHAHVGNVSSVAWSPNGLFLATCGGWGGPDWTVRLWNSEDLNDSSIPITFRRLHEAAILDVAWSHDSVFVASASDDGTVRLWDTRACEPGPILSGHQQRVLAVGWNSRERMLASAGGDHTIRVWDVRDAGAIDQLTTPRTFEAGDSWIRSVKWSPDNSQIAYAGLSWVTLLNASTGQTIWSQPPPYRAGSLSWHPDGRRIACGKCGFLNARTGFLQGATIPHQVAFDPTGQFLAAGGWKSNVQVWDTEQDRLVWLAVLLTDNNSAVFSGAGELLNPDPLFDEQLIYVLQDDEGNYSLSAPADFRSRFNK